MNIKDIAALAEIVKQNELTKLEINGENIVIERAAQVVQAARDFAAAIFGGEQAGRLLDFYGGHGAPVISICSRYLRGRLAKKVIRAQRAKR